MHSAQCLVIHETEQFMIIKYKWEMSIEEQQHIAKTIERSVKINNQDIPTGVITGEYLIWSADHTHIDQYGMFSIKEGRQHPVCPLFKITKVKEAPTQEQRIKELDCLAIRIKELRKELVNGQE